MIARPKHVWLGFLEAQEFVVPHGWKPVLVEVSADVAREMLSALGRMGVPCCAHKDRDVVMGKLDDARERCRVHEDGQGKHVCDECQRSVLTRSLELSVGGAA